MASAATRGWIALALATGLALSGCEGKETGPESEATAPSAPVVATPMPPATADPNATKPLLSFAGMDTDGDSQVTSAEQAKASQAIFLAMDADKDGGVTLSEMDAARDAIGERPDLSSEKLIRAADADNNAKLTLAEWVAASNARFTRFDANRDGALDADEWTAGIAAEAPAADPAAVPTAALPIPAKK